MASGVDSSTDPLPGSDAPLQQASFSIKRSRNLPENWHSVSRWWNLILLSLSYGSGSSRTP